MNQPATSTNAGVGPYSRMDTSDAKIFAKLLIVLPCMFDGGASLDCACRCQMDEQWYVTVMPKDVNLFFCSLCYSYAKVRSKIDSAQH